MTEQQGNGAIDRAMEASIESALGRERYARRQHEARRGSANREDVARPLEFHESGFPVPQRAPTFFERLTRVRSSS